jgi:hypothetical protein
MFSEYYKDKLPLIKTIFDNGLKQIEVLPCYQFECIIYSDSHKLINKELDEISQFSHTAYSYTAIDDGAFLYSQKIPKTSFTNSLEDDPAEVINRFQKIFDFLCVSLSICSLGRFWWQRSFNVRKFTLQYDTEKKVAYNCKPEPLIVPIEVDEHDQLIYDKHETLDLPVFLVSLLLGNIIERQNWISLFYNYRKALHLLFNTNPDLVYNEEIFLLFYKSLENLITVDFYKKKKLSNELFQIKKALQEKGLPSSYIDDFDGIYQVRSSLVAHNQSPKFEIVSFKNILDIKLLLESYIIVDIMDYLYFAKDINLLETSDLRKKK